MTRWSLVLASLFAVCIGISSTACYTTLIDPQCFFGRDEVHRYGTLWINVQSQHKGEVRMRNIRLRGDGLLSYEDQAVKSCQRPEDGRAREVAELWSTVARELPAPQCGPGFALVPARGVSACFRRKEAMLARGYREGTSYMNFKYYAVDRSVELVWDLRAEVPGVLEEAVNGTWKVLCEESTRISRYVRRNLPELAARTGC